MDVRHTVISSESVIGHLVSDGCFRASHGLVQAAPERVWRITCYGVIHPDAGKIYILRLAGITPVLEADVAESETYDVSERVIRTIKDRRSILKA